jgi:hypothetical protein
MLHIDKTVTSVFLRCTPRGTAWRWTARDSLIADRIPFVSTIPARGRWSVRRLAHGPGLHVIAVDSKGDILHW